MQTFKIFEEWRFPSRLGMLLRGEKIRTIRRWIFSYVNRVELEEHSHTAAGKGTEVREEGVPGNANNLIW